MSDEFRKAAEKLLDKGIVGRNGTIKWEDLFDPEFLAKYNMLKADLLAQLPPPEPGDFRLLNDESGAAQISYLREKLKELPNAFDLVTGKLNENNHEAVMLYSTLQATIEYSKYPILWRRKPE